MTSPTPKGTAQVPMRLGTVGLSNGIAFLVSYLHSL